VDESGHEVGPGETGELVIRGPNVMQGYWNAPEESARVFRPDGEDGERALYSGDLFRSDEEGFLYFAGRKDDQIKTMGERVSPKEIEAVLCTLPSVSEAAVIGVPDTIAGRAVKAVIVAAPGAGPTVAGIIRHCRKHLEPFMIPKYVEFVASLPLTPHGKIDKPALERTHRDSSAAGQEEC
jgi:acyl-coenzyme A synthetase/AMP-(fatty) acid ligase